MRSNHFKTNSPQVLRLNLVVDKLRIEPDKFLGTTDPKLEQVSKMYTTMHRSLAECAREPEESLKAAYQMLK